MLTKKQMGIYAVFLLFSLVSADGGMGMPAAGTSPGTGTSKNANAGSEAGVGDDSQYPPRIMFWMSPNYLSSFMLFLFTLYMFMFGAGMLGSV